MDYFSLADNALMDMQRHVLRHLPHVKTLDLRRNKIAKLTEEDFQVTTAYWEMENFFLKNFSSNNHFPVYFQFVFP